MNNTINKLDRDNAEKIRDKAKQIWKKTVIRTKAEKEVKEDMEKCYSEASKEIGRTEEVLRVLSEIEEFSSYDMSDLKKSFEKFLKDKKVAVSNLKRKKDEIEEDLAKLFEIEGLDHIVNTYNGVFKSSGIRKEIAKYKNKNYSDVYSYINMIKKVFPDEARPELTKIQPDLEVSTTKLEKKRWKMIEQMEEDLGTIKFLEDVTNHPQTIDKMVQNETPDSVLEEIEILKETIAKEKSEIEELGKKIERINNMQRRLKKVKEKPYTEYLDGPNESYGTWD